MPLTSKSFNGYTVAREYDVRNCEYGDYFIVTDSHPWPGYERGLKVHANQIGDLAMLFTEWQEQIKREGLPR